MAAYSGTQWEGITIDPASIGLKTIGHMGYFKPQAKALWVQALDWFDHRCNFESPAASTNTPAPAAIAAFMP